jgi:hypothetical protein
MTDQLAENNRPSNVGDDSNLSPDVRAVAGLRPRGRLDDHGSKVRARSPWRLQPGLFDCRFFLPLLICLLLPPRTHKPVPFWILTATELRIVAVGFKQSWDSVCTIPLDGIIACGVKSANWYQCLPHIYVEVSQPIMDEFGISDSTETIVGLAFVGQDWLSQEILRRRDRLQTMGRTTTSSNTSIMLPSNWISAMH